MKKLIGILAAVGLTTTAGTTVVACNTKSIVPKVELNTKLVNLTVNNLQCIDSQSVLLGRIVDLNKNSGVQTSDLQIQDYHPASYTSSGSAKIIAKSSSHFKGDVNVYISKLEQTNINEILYGKLGLGRFDSIQEATLRAQEIIDFLGLKDLVTLSPAQNNKIHVKSNQESLIGEADFIFEIFGKLQDLLSGKLNLGYVISTEDATFKAKSVLCELKLNKKVDLSKPSEGKIHVKAKEKSSVKGEADFTYILSKDLGKLLEGKTNLGYVSNDNEAMKKAQEIINNIPELKGHVNWSPAENGKIIVTPKDETLTGEATFTYQLQKSIAKLLEGKTNLGYVDDVVNAEIDAQMIINSIPELRNSVRLEPAQNGKIHVIPSDESLTGEAYFEYQVRINIADVLKDELNLGEVSSPDEAEAKMKVILQKHDLLDKVEWKVYPNENKITVLENHDSVIGIVHFTYTITQETIAKSIASLIKNTTIKGDIANTKEKIIEEVLRLNPNSTLTASDLQITSLIPANEDKDGKAVILPMPNRGLGGHVYIEITHLTPTPKKADLRYYIYNRIIDGDIANTKDTVLGQVIKINHPDIIGAIKVENFKAATKTEEGSMTLKPLEGSNFFGFVVITITKLTK